MIFKKRIPLQDLTAPDGATSAVHYLGDGVSVWRCLRGCGQAWAGPTTVVTFKVMHHNEGGCPVTRWRTGGVIKDPKVQVSE